MSKALLIVILVVMILTIEALRCYDGGVSQAIELKNCSDCKFCGIGMNLDSSFGIGKNNFDHARLAHMAVGETELDEGLAVALEQLLRQSDDYKILSTCILEAYDFSFIGRNKPEIMLRCFCKSNQCNKAESLSEYFGRLARSETFKVQDRLDDHQSIDALQATVFGLL